MLYAPRYCLTASAGILACGQRKRTGSNPRIAYPQSRFARRYSHQWLSATAISGATCSFMQSKRVSLCVVFVASQPKHQLQGSGCAADRASRSDDETGGKPSDQACLILMDSLLFHKPLKLTIFRTQLTWRKQQRSPRQAHSPAGFFAAFFPGKKARTPLPRRKRVSPRQKARTPSCLKFSKKILLFTATRRMSAYQ